MPVMVTRGLPLAGLTGAPFVTSVSANGRYLLDQYTNPITMVADSAWGLAANVSTSDYATYFATRQSQGFNAVLVELVADTYSGISPNNATTFDGIPAFTGTVTGPYPDLTTPNPSYWSRMDTLVALAASYGITLILVPADFSNVISVTYMMNAGRNNGHANCVSFGNFLGTRYAPGSAANPHGCIIWMHCNDYNSAIGTDDSYAGGVLTGIQQVAPSMLHTVEYVTGPVSAYSLQASTFWQTNIQLDQCYPTSTDAPYTIMQSAYNAQAMPTFLGEDQYENQAGVTNFNMRAQAYWATTSGALGGYFYGNQNLYGFTSGWQGQMSTTAVTQTGYWGSLLAGLNWWKLVPDFGNTFLTSGLGSGFSKSTGAVSADGSLGMVYAVANNPVVAMTAMRGTTLARWYDPTAGTFSTIGSFANTGSHTFTLPAAHSDGNSDSVLVLTA